MYYCPRPGVKDVAVFGFEGIGGEVPRAHGNQKEGHEMGEEDVMGWVKGALAGYEQLEGGVRSLDSIPKTASGKILKRLLRVEAKMEGTAGCDVNRLVQG